MSRNVWTDRPRQDRCVGRITRWQLEEILSKDPKTADTLIALSPIIIFYRNTTCYIRTIHTLTQIYIKNIAHNFMYIFLSKLLSFIALCVFSSTGNIFILIHLTCQALFSHTHNRKVVFFREPFLHFLLLFYGNSTEIYY